MMPTVYHVIIANELRKGDRISPFTYTSADKRTQIYSIGDSISDNPNVIYAVEWDQQSPFVVVHKGKLGDANMGFAGWPMVTKDEWEAQVKAQEQAFVDAQGAVDGVAS